MALKPPWQKGQSGNPGGRPKLPKNLKVVKEFTSDELRRLISKHFRMDKAAIKAVLESSNSSAIELLICSSIFRAIKDGDMAKAEYLFLRSLGRVKDTVEAPHLEPVVIKRQDGTEVELSAKIGEPAE